MDEVTCADAECVSEAEFVSDHYDDIDEFYSCLQSNVWTSLVTDWDHAWFPSFCDKCGTHWLANEHDADLLVGALSDYSPMEFGRQYGARLKGSRDWASVCTHVRTVHGLELEYRDGVPVAIDAEFSTQREIRAIADEVVRRATPQTRRRKSQTRKPVIPAHQLELTLGGA